MIRPAVLRAVSLLLGAPLLLAIGGCRGIVSPTPQLAERNFTPHEQQWHQAVKTWYPGLREPMLPIQPRDLSASAQPADAGWLPQRRSPASALSRSAVAPVSPRPVSSQTVAFRTPAPSPARSAQPVVLPASPRPPAAESFVVVPDDTVPAVVTPESGRTYRVGKGETLASIARKVYGDSSAWHRIYDANADRIGDPNRIRTGMQLRIP